MTLFQMLKQSKIHMKGVTAQAMADGNKTN